MPCQLASMHRAVPGYSWTTQFWGGKGLVVWMWAAPCHLTPESQNRFTAVDVSYRSWLTPGGSEEASCDCSKHDSTEKKAPGTTPRRSPKAFRCAVHQQKRHLKPHWVQLKEQNLGCLLLVESTQPGKYALRCMQYQLGTKWFIVPWFSFIKLTKSGLINADIC